MFGIVSDKTSRISEQFYNVEHGSKKLQNDGNGSTK